MKPLKPVMAALLAASSATFGMPRISYADDDAPATAPADPSATPPADPSAAATPTPASVPPSAPSSSSPSPCSASDTHNNPVNILACIISQNQTARADIGDRLAKFMQSLYLKADILNDATMLRSVLAIAKDWPEQTKNDPSRVARLYFVVGPDGPLPSWAAQDPVLVKTLKPGMNWSKRLARALANDHWTDSKQIAQGPKAVNAATAFLEDAADWAQKVLEDSRTKAEISTSIGDNDTTAPVVPTTGGGSSSNPLTPASSGFTREDLYVKGAEVANVYGPNDKGYRTLSMKVYSKKDDSGNVINTVAIVDITAGETPSVPQFVNISQPTDKPIDIVMRDGGRHYSLTVGPDGSVTLTRAGATGGGAIKTSRSQLTADRDDQIRRGGVVMIGGQPYYALGQGGVKGSILFFSKAQMDADPNASAHPALMGDVSQVISDGSTQQVSGKPDLGTLPDGTQWHMEFNMNTGLWDVVSGPGDSTKKPGGGGATPPAKTPGGGATPPSTPPSGGGATPQTGDSGSPPATLDAAVQLAEQDKPDKTQVWTFDQSENNGSLSDALRVLYNTQSDGLKHFLVLFDPTLGVTDNKFEFRAMTPVTNGAPIILTDVGVLSKYVVTEYSNGTQYYDLTNFVAYIKQATDSSQSSHPAGSYAASNGQMQDVTDVDIAVDILVNYMKVDPSDPMIQTIRDRVAKDAQGGSYKLNGSDKGLVLTSGGTGTTIWPNEIKAGDTTSNDGLAGLRGPGTAVNLAAGPDAEFQPGMVIGGNVNATRLKPYQDHVALYTDDKPEGTDQSAPTITYIMLDYLKDGQVSRTKPFAVFGDKGQLHLPVGYQMQGLETVEMDPQPADPKSVDSSAPKSSPQLAMLAHSSQSDGALVVYRYAVPASGGGNIKDSAGNCAGPVIWWGSVTKEKAQAACAGSGSL